MIVFSFRNPIVVIITDGQENFSKNYTKEQIYERINYLQTHHGWKFIYLGANQDSFEVAKGLGINISKNYEYTPQGLDEAISSITDGISRSISLS